MVRSRAEHGVSNHVAAPSFETRPPAAPQDEAERACARKERYCPTSIFTAVVIVCHCFSSLASHFWASSTDLLGTML